MSDNPFRPEYRDLSDLEKSLVADVKLIAGGLFEKIEEANGQADVGRPETRGRHFAIAKTKLEEAVMWAVKGIT